MEKVLLHVCCGPCSMGCFDKLKDKELVLYFSNSNINTRAEWVRRLLEARKAAKIYGFEIAEDTYNHGDWRAFVAGLEDEPEKGKRCIKCFEFSLDKAAKFAKEHGIKYFTSTLSVSKYKISKDLFAAGRKVAEKYGLTFLEIDFKEDFGYEKSIDFSNKHNIYRQNYCGCEFSVK